MQQIQLIRSIYNWWNEYEKLCFELNIYLIKSVTKWAHEPSSYPKTSTGITRWQNCLFIWRGIGQIHTAVVSSIQNFRIWVERKMYIQVNKVYFCNIWEEYHLVVSWRRVSTSTSFYFSEKSVTVTKYHIFFHTLLTDEIAPEQERLDIYIYGSYG